jgi:hypothetical protein
MMRWVAPMPVRQQLQLVRRQRRLHAVRLHPHERHFRVFQRLARERQAQQQSRQREARQREALRQVGLQRHRLRHLSLRRLHLDRSATIRKNRFCHPVFSEQERSYPPGLSGFSEHQVRRKPAIAPTLEVQSPR